MFAHNKSPIVNITKPSDKPKLLDQAKTFSPKEIGLNYGLSRSAGNFFGCLSTSPKLSPTSLVSASLSSEADEKQKVEKSKNSESYDVLGYSNDSTSKSSADDEVKFSSSSDSLDDVFSGFSRGR